MSNKEVFKRNSRALSIINEFYDKDIVIYVEGNSDYSFWNILLQRYFRYKYKINKVYGKLNLRAYIDDIIDNDTNIIVLADRDYDEFKEELKNHSRIIYSEGYSIENSLFINEIINKIIFTKANGCVPEEDFEECLNGFLEEARPVITYDIINELTASGKVVLSESCQEIMTTQSSNLVCNIKLTNKLAKLEDLSHMISQIEEKINMRLSLIVRGKWLMSFIRNYIISSCEFLMRREYEEIVKLDNKEGNLKMTRFNSNMLHNDLRALLLISLESCLYQGLTLQYYESKLNVTL